MRRFLLGLNLFIGFGAMAGSMMALLPGARESVGIDASMLVNSPFTSFLIPGLFLLLVNGVGNLLTGYTLFKNRQNAPYFECLMGLIMCSWIVIQCIMLMAVEYLHIIFFFLGATQLIGGILIIRKLQLPFPFAAHQN